MKKYNPVLTKDTLMIDEHSQKIIAACKTNEPYMESLKKCVADITGLEVKYVDYHSMYHWLSYVFEQLNKPILYKRVLSEAFHTSVWHEKLNVEERILTVMASELCLLQINDHNESGELIALIDMSKVS